MRAFVSFDMTAASFLARFLRRAAASSTDILRVSIRCVDTAKTRPQTRPERACSAFHKVALTLCVCKYEYRVKIEADADE